MKSIRFLREVLARRAAVVGGAATVLSLLVNQGIIAPELSSRVTGWITTAFVVAGVLGTVLAVRPEVTPTMDPRDKDGNHLVAEPNPEDVVAVRDTVADYQGEHQEEYVKGPDYDVPQGDEDIDPQP